MLHSLKATLHDYWSRFKQMHTPFYGENMIWDRFLHILRFLHFSDNSRRPDPGEEYDRLWKIKLWKIRTILYTLNQAYPKFYNPLEHLAVDEVIVKFQAGLFSGSTFPRKGNILASKFTNCVTNQGIHTTWKCTWVETHALPRTRLQHTQLLDIWFAELKA